MKSILEIRCHS